MSIIHTAQTMTVRQYSLYEADRNPRHLYRRFKWLAQFGLYVDDIEAFIKQFNELFNPESVDDFFRHRDKLIYQNKLVIMQALAEAIHLHLVTRVEMKITCERIGMKLPPDEQLQKYLDEIEQVAGIKVTSLDDIAAFKDELARKIDKFNELFAEKEQVKGVSIMDLFYACCGILEQSPDYVHMTLSELAIFKAQADAKAKRMEEMYSKNK